MDTKTPRRRFSRAERERQILDAAVAVFTDRGFQNASMDAVAERVGVTKPVLYTHFGSKDGLLLACIARARAELLDATTTAAAAATNPEEMMRFGLKAFFDFLDAQGSGWRLLYTESTVGGEALESIRAQQTDFIAALLSAQAPNAESQRLTAWAHIIVGACERLALWRGGPDTVSSAEATDYLMDLVWEGLGHRPAQSPP